MEAKVLQLGEVTDYQSGLWTGKNGTLTPAKVIRVTEIRDDGTYDLSTAKELQVEAKKLGTRRILPSSILLERSGGGENKPVGRVIYFEDDVLEDIYSFSNFTTLLLPKKDMVLPKYLFYFLYFFHLSGKTKNLQKAVTGIRNLEFAKYLEQPIIIPFNDGKPDLSKQEQVVEKLDQLFSEIKKATGVNERQKLYTKALKVSLLSILKTEASTFENLELENVLAPVSEQVQPKDFGNTAYVGLEHISSFELSLKDVGTADQVRSTKWRFKSGDILYGKLRPYLNKCVVADRDGICSTDILVFRAKESISAKYVAYLMSTPDFVKFASGTVSGMNLPRTTWSKIKNYSIRIPVTKQSIPNLKEQNRIAERLDTGFALSEKLMQDFVGQGRSLLQLQTSTLRTMLSIETQNAPTLSPIQNIDVSPIQQGISVVLKRFQRGEMVVAKVLYVAQTVFKIPLGINFTQQAFGPYSSQIASSVRDGLSTKKQYFARKGTLGKEVLCLGAGSDNILDHLDTSLKTKMNAYLDQMMPHYFSTDSHSIELLATVCKIIEDEKTSDDTVIRQKLHNWKPGRFQDSETFRTISFIKKNKWDQKILQ